MKRPHGPRPWGIVSVAAIALALGSSENASLLCEYSRAAIARGEVWRLWTSSFVHFSGSHLFWNLLVVAIAGIWAELRAPRAVRAYLAVAPLVIGLALWWFQPSLETYRGLSGVAAGLVVVMAWLLAREGKKIEAATIALLVVLKIAAEAVSATPLLARFVDDRIIPVAAAHLAGALSAAGILVGYLAAKMRKKSKKKALFGNPAPHNNFLRRTGPRGRGPSTLILGRIQILDRG